MDRADGAGESENDSVSYHAVFEASSDIAQGMGWRHLRRRGLLQRLR